MHFFDTTQALEFNWVLHGDGCELGSGILPLLVIEPQRSHETKWESGPWFSAWTLSSAAEIYLTITAKLLNSTRWANSGHLISSTQVLLPSRRNVVPHVYHSYFTFLISLVLLFSDITDYCKNCYCFRSLKAPMPLYFVKLLMT